jgi:pentatricopeptide repeat protein
VFCAAAEHGDMSYAVSVFEKTENPDAFIWSTMIRGFGKTNDAPKAFEFYKRMQERGLVADDFTFSFLLKVCGQLGSVLLGRQMHCITLNMGLINMSLLGTLLFMYMECSRILKHPANGYSQP